MFTAQSAGDNSQLFYVRLMMALMTILQCFWQQIGKFVKPYLIRKGDTKIPLTLSFHLNETGIEFETRLFLYTNASTFAIPLYIYSGRLQVLYLWQQPLRRKEDEYFMNLTQCKLWTGCSASTRDISRPARLWHGWDGDAQQYAVYSPQQ